MIPTQALTYLAAALLLAYALLSTITSSPAASALTLKTRALSQGQALSLVAISQLLGFGAASLLLGSTLPSWFVLLNDSRSLPLLLSALLAALSWLLITWQRRLPSSATQALIGGLIGAYLMACQQENQLPFPLTSPWLLVPLLLAPPLIFLLSYLLVFPLFSLTQETYPAQINQNARTVLVLASSLTALAQGLLAGQRLLPLAGLILALGSGQASSHFILYLLLALALVLGACRASSRISYHLTQQLVRSGPFRAAIAQSSSALALLLTQALWSAPLSPSQATCSALLGAGSNQSLSGVQPRRILALLTSWALTLPINILTAGAIYYLLTLA